MCAVGAATSCVQSFAVSVFADCESLRGHLSESASDLAFPKGVTRSHRLHARHLSCVWRIRDPEPALLPMRLGKLRSHRRRVSRLRAAQWVCSKRSSRTPTRENIALCSFCYTISKAREL